MALNSDLLLRLGFAIGVGAKETIRSILRMVREDGLSRATIQEKVRLLKKEVPDNFERIFAYAEGLIDAMWEEPADPLRPAKENKRESKPDGNHQISFCNKVTPEFSKRMEKLRASNQPAFEFLFWLTGVESKGIWISTAINAHLYRNNYFLAYLQFQNLSHPVPYISMSPRYNVSIVGGTSDEHEFLFPVTINKMIEALNGFQKKWAKKTDTGVIHLLPETPKDFFEAIMTFLKDERNFASHSS